MDIVLKSDYILFQLGFISAWEEIYQVGGTWFISKQESGPSVFFESADLVKFLHVMVNPFYKNNKTWWWCSFWEALVCSFLGNDAFSAPIFVVFLKESGMFLKQRECFTAPWPIPWLCLRLPVYKLISEMAFQQFSEFIRKLHLLWVERAVRCFVLNSQWTNW